MVQTAPVHAGVLGQRVLRPVKLRPCKWPCASVAGERKVFKSAAVLLKGSKVSGVSFFSKRCTRIHTEERLHAYKCYPEPDLRAALAVQEVLWSLWRQATKQLCFPNGPLVPFSGFSFMGDGSV